jgi:hypothetical protein
MSVGYIQNIVYIYLCIKIESAEVNIPKFLAICSKHRLPETYFLALRAHKVKVG